MTTPPPLNGQVLSPAYAHPIGGETRIIYVNAPGNNLARAGSDLLRTLSFGSAALGIAFVVGTAILPPAINPGVLFGIAQGTVTNSYNDTTRASSARTAYETDLARGRAANLAAEEGMLGQTAGLGVLGCILGGIVTNSLASNGHSDGAATSREVTNGACQLGSALHQYLGRR